jgi:Flp pilus assembly pilin Flp
MRAFLGSFLSNESGASVIDYTLIGAAISLVIITMVLAIGDDIEKPFASITDALSAAVSQR